MRIHSTAIIGVVGCALLSLGFSTQGVSAASEKKSAPSIKRGKYLVDLAGCGHCHTPHDKNGEPMKGFEFAGHPEFAPLPEWDESLMAKNILVAMGPTLTAFAGPWGVTIATNLTPDKETGIGAYKAKDLIKSFKSHMTLDGKRTMMPPMPNYSQMSEEDITSIYMYLKAQPAVKNKAPKSNFK